MFDTNEKHSRGPPPTVTSEAGTETATKPAVFPADLRKFTMKPSLAAGTEHLRPTSGRCPEKAICAGWVTSVCVSKQSEIGCELSTVRFPFRVEFDLLVDGIACVRENQDKEREAREKRGNFRYWR